MDFKFTHQSFHDEEKFFKSESKRFLKIDFGENGGKVDPEFLFFCLCVSLSLSLSHFSSSQLLFAFALTIELENGCIHLLLK